MQYTSLAAHAYKYLNASPNPMTVANYRACLNAGNPTTTVNLGAHVRGVANAQQNRQQYQAPQATVSPPCHHLTALYGGYWVRGHLLNGSIGGPGTADNLYPIPKSMNSHHYHEVEKHVIDTIADPNTVFPVTYEVESRIPAGLANPLTPADSGVTFRCTARDGNGTGILNGAAQVNVT